MTLVSFYLFSTLLISGGILTIFSQNPVHSVLWLIGCFFSAACLFVLIGAEFLAMLILVVYVGAVAVLFLFVVMMLDIDFSELKAGLARYLPLALLLGLVILVEVGFVMGTFIISHEGISLNVTLVHVPSDAENIVKLGRTIYTYHILMFQTSGLILLVAMIGAIVLTLNRRTHIKKQDVTIQLYRDSATSVELRDVKSGQGTR